nr:hypothetical protein [uncultured Fluviicola sp.]
MKKILTGLVLLVTFPTLSQSDSVDFSMSFVTNPTFTAGLDEVSQQGDVFQVSVSLNELNFIGQLNQKQIMSETYVQSGFPILNFPYLIPTATCQVILERQNIQQAYLPYVEKTFITN